MPSQSQSQKRILIMEDEAAVALELEDALRDAGYLPVGPAFSTQEAQALVAAKGFDGALIDVGMVKECHESILPSLLIDKVPFLFLTGYGHTELPASLPKAETVLKPFCAPDLVRRLDELFEECPLN